MTDPAPCTSAFTDTMRELHSWIVGGVGVTALMTAGVLLDRLRMLWFDYRKKHSMNGSKEV